MHTIDFDVGELDIHPWCPIPFIKQHFFLRVDDVMGFTILAALSPFCDVCVFRIYQSIRSI